MQTITARWDLPSEGYVEPNRQRVIASAWRLAGLVDPGFVPTETRQPVSSSYDVDDFGGSLSATVYRLGDATHGLEITDRVSDANDGMTPFGEVTAITVYGLPEGCTIALEGNLAAPLYGEPNPVWLEARLPEAMAEAVASALRADYGATVEVAGAAGPGEPAHD